MVEHATKCNQSGDFLSKIKLMSFVNIDLSFVKLDFWYPSLSLNSACLICSSKIGLWHLATILLKRIILRAN